MLKNVMNPMSLHRFMTPISIKADVKLIVTLRLARLFKSLKTEEDIYKVLTTLPDFESYSILLARVWAFSSAKFRTLKFSNI